ncbi:hypothetical protein O181_098552 [Austropuccinia psidii MF-1]|uniref:Uncharacterized protein n=1 Tax=Austropuccinia psidii MF-1 TaxID=1389203 RepID=A0A9Q3JAN0_9BASI|nr:hypothetical protein [Austropuccinia psidii MF-1]
MPVQLSPPAKNTISQKNHAVLTPTARAPLYGTPSVNQLSETFDRGPPMEREEPSRRGGLRSRLGKAKDEEGEYEENEVAAALEVAPEASEAENLSHSNKTLLSQAEPNFLKTMEQMTKFMGQLTQEFVPRGNSRAKEFKTPSMKETYPFDGTQAHKLRIFIQSSQLIYHNDPANFFSDRKKVLY